MRLTSPSVLALFNIKISEEYLQALSLFYNQHLKNKSLLYPKIPSQ